MIFDFSDPVVQEGYSVGVKRVFIPPCPYPDGSDEADKWNEGVSQAVEDGEALDALEVSE